MVTKIGPKYNKSETHVRNTRAGHLLIFAYLDFTVPAPIAHQLQASKAVDVIQYFVGETEPFLTRGWLYTKPFLTRWWLYTEPFSYQGVVMYRAFSLGDSNQTTQKQGQTQWFLPGHIVMYSQNHSCRVTTRFPEKKKDILVTSIDSRSFCLIVLPQERTIS